MSSVSVFLTGFGPFLNVTENPSDTIMRLVSEQLEGQNTLLIRGTHVLEVSVQAVTRYMQAIMPQVDAEAESAAGGAVLMVHFGVHRAAESRIQIETHARNCVTIPSGDHSGFKQPVCCPIVCDPSVGGGSASELGRAAVAEDNEYDAQKHDGESSKAAAEVMCPVTALVTPLEPLIQEICSTLPPIVIEQDNGQRRVSLSPSVDAGLYLCSFCLFLSLRSLCLRAKQCIAELPQRLFDVYRQSGALQSDQSLHNTTEEEARLKRRKRPVYSFFIHVMDPEKVPCEKQAEAISELLQKLVAKLL